MWVRRVRVAIATSVGALLILGGIAPFNTGSTAAASTGVADSKIEAPDSGESVQSGSDLDHQQSGGNVGLDISEPANNSQSLVPRWSHNQPSAVNTGLGTEQGASVFTCEPVRGSIYSLEQGGTVRHEGSGANYAPEVGQGGGWKGYTTGAQNVAAFALNFHGTRAHAITSGGGDWTVGNRGNTVRDLLVYTPTDHFFSPFTFTGERTLSVDGAPLPKIDTGALVFNREWDVSGGSKEGFPYTYWLGGTYEVKQAGSSTVGFAMFAWDMNLEQVERRKSAGTAEIDNPFTLRVKLDTGIPWSPISWNTVPNFSSLVFDGLGGAFLTVTEPISQSDRSSVRGHIYSLPRIALAGASTNNPVIEAERVLIGEGTVAGDRGLIGALFDPFGYIYLVGSGGINRYSLYTGLPEGPALAVGYHMDSATNCQAPPVIEVSKDLTRFVHPPMGNEDPSVDQFSFRVRRPDAGVQPFVGELETKGDEDGVQPHTLITPVTDATREWSGANQGWVQDPVTGYFYPNFSKVTPNRYLVSENLVGAGEVEENYDSSYHCTANASAEEMVSAGPPQGEGTVVYQGDSPGFLMPIRATPQEYGPGGIVVSCRFTNRAISSDTDAVLTANVEFDQASLEDWGERFATGTQGPVAAPWWWSNRVSATQQVAAGDSMSVRFGLVGGAWTRSAVPPNITYQLGASTPEGQLDSGFSYTYSWSKTGAVISSTANVVPTAGDELTGNVNVELKPAAIRLNFGGVNSPSASARGQWLLTATQGEETHAPNAGGEWGPPVDVRAGTWVLKVERRNGSEVPAHQTYTVEDWSCEDTEHEIQPVVTRIPPPEGEGGEDTWTVSVLNGAQVECTVTMARTVLAVLVQTVDPTGGMPLQPSDFQVSAIAQPPFEESVPSLEAAVGSQDVELPGEGVEEFNAIPARTGATYKLSQSRRPPGDGVSGYPSALVALQRYVPSDEPDSACPPITDAPPIPNPPNMDSQCWVDISSGERDNGIVIDGFGGYAIYRFVNSTLSVAQLPEAGGKGALIYVAGGIAVVVGAGLLGWQRLRNTAVSRGRERVS